MLVRTGLFANIPKYIGFKFSARVHGLFRIFFISKEMIAVEYVLMYWNMYCVKTPISNLIIFNGKLIIIAFCIIFFSIFKPKQGNLLAS